MRGRLDAEDVKAALRVPAVLDWFGVEYRDRPEIRLAMCPACGGNQRRASFLVDRESGEWFHHGGAAADGRPCRGDIFALVAALAGLDARRDFPRVLELGATIAGLSPEAGSDELARRREEYRARRAAAERAAAEESAAAAARVTLLWSALATRHPHRGESYLASRGLDPAQLIACGAVRFRADGSPCVLLHDLDTCAPANIVTRQIDGEPKVLTLDIRRTLGKREAIGSHSTLGSLVGRVADLDTTGEGADVAILVEGVADTLAAILAFPGCVVVGANGWYRMADIAAAIAPRVAAARGWLLVGVHDDEEGIAGATRAIRAAAAAGLVIGESVAAIETAPHKDLADGWRAGWRWQWPDRLGTGTGGSS